MAEEYGFEEILEEMTPRSDLEPGVGPDDLQSILKAAIDDSVAYCEEDLQGERQDAVDAYRGEGLENDADLDATRSKAMSRDVHDTVHAILPSLIRVFLKPFQRERYGRG